MGDILDEAKKSEDRPLKKRKTARSNEKGAEIEEIPAEDVEELFEEDEDDDDDEDEEWEDVELNQVPVNDFELPSENEDEDEDEGTLNITINKQDIIEIPKKVRKKANVLPKKEREHRIVVHKIHILSLLYHLRVRNKWCSCYALRTGLKTCFTQTTMQELHPPGHLSLTLKSRKFLDGLRHAMYHWKRRFRISSRGIYNVQWSDIFLRDRVLETRLNLQKFVKRVLTFRGSRDVSAQGFVAALRAADVDARLVCSIQPLDFTSSLPFIGSNQQDTIENPSGIKSNQSEYPTFWVEAYDSYSEHWVTLDPAVAEYIDIVRASTKPKLEPPGTDKCNLLRYVIAFNPDGTAVDVTRRYTNQYGTKVLKKRLNYLTSGDLWWDSVMLLFAEESGPSDRYLREQTELNLRESGESLPTSIQAYRNHPRFALVQTLKQSEVLLKTAKPCGKLATKNGSIEVFSRQDIRDVKSAMAWYRLGRTVKPQSQPLKRMKAKRRIIEGDEDAEEGLYSEAQTELYVPPPVENGIVPKNAFKNIDVYVPSMVPAGAVHLPYDNVAIAARLIEVDYADAVTGFEFVNRRMMPRKTGIIVAEEHAETVMDVYQELLEEQRREDEQKERLAALMMWKKMFSALALQHRLNERYGHIIEEANEEAASSEAEEEAMAGGFLPGKALLVPPNEDEDDVTGGFMPSDANIGDAYEEDDATGGFIPSGTRNAGVDDDHMSGGFVPIENIDSRTKETLTELDMEEEGGGFFTGGGAPSDGKSQRSVPIVEEIELSSSDDEQTNAKEIIEISDSSRSPSAQLLIPNILQLQTVEESTDEEMPHIPVHTFYVVDDQNGPYASVVDGTKGLAKSVPKVEPDTSNAMPNKLRGVPATDAPGKAPGRIKSTEDEENSSDVYPDSVSESELLEGVSE
ncbi:DNA repair protein Rad4p [Trichomonascus vanleenenianus]|uniref:DNA repair protein Rad4p n=1 Tax=Trichomonascus vanleenenianus TaxID=2268995 RepID=UPI003ECB073A